MSRMDTRHDVPGGLIMIKGYISGPDGDRIIVDLVMSLSVSVRKSILSPLPPPISAWYEGVSKVQQLSGDGYRSRVCKETIASKLQEFIAWHTFGVALAASKCYLDPRPQKYSCLIHGPVRSIVCWCCLLNRLVMKPNVRLMDLILSCAVLAQEFK